MKLEITSDPKRKAIIVNFTGNFKINIPSQINFYVSTYPLSE